MVSYMDARKGVAKFSIFAKPSSKFENYPKERIEIFHAYAGRNGQNLKKIEKLFFLEFHFKCWGGIRSSCLISSIFLISYMIPFKNLKFLGEVREPVYPCILTSLDLILIEILKSEIFEEKIRIPCELWLCKILTL